jgi:hypothetical protein
MKTFTFSVYGVHSQSFKCEIEIASDELAKEMDISVEEVEAMTEEKMKAYMKEKMYVLEGLVDSVDNDLDWGDTEYNCDSDFYLDINEDGE